MGPLQERLTADMKSAMKAGEKDKLLLVRMLIADLKNEQVNANTDDLDAETEITVVRRASKVRRDEIETAREAGRDEALQKAERELAWIEEYLPQQMDAAEIEAKAKELLDELGITERKEQGRFMKEWMARYRAVSDGKTVNQVLGKLLS